MRARVGDSQAARYAIRRWLVLLTFAIIHLSIIWI
jgi:uncharacterized membrane protein YeiB